MIPMMSMLAEIPNIRTKLECFPFFDELIAGDDEDECVGGSTGEEATRGAV